MIKSPIQLCIPEISNHEIETVSKVLKLDGLPTENGIKNLKIPSLGILVQNMLLV